MLLEAAHFSLKIREVMLYTSTRRRGAALDDAHKSAREAGAMTLVNAQPAQKTLVLRGADLEFVEGHASEPGEGVRVAEYLGPGNGAVHHAVALVELLPGATVEGHLHPFEESFFVLRGTPLARVAGRSFRLAPGDFGLVPVASGHSWANPGPEPARLLRVYSPLPRPIGGKGGWGVYAAPDVAAPDDGVEVDELDPRHALVGHFDDSDMPPPAPILMPGYHGANIRNVSIRMMVDELLGARHHTLFVVEFTPSGVAALSAKEHFHPFEEMYYFLSGEAIGSFDGERIPIEAGDLVFAAVGASHGFSAVGEQPVRWIEAQAPLPPAENGFFFHNDWDKLENIG
jgi:mannose-6-phosphate isomerase-like protein (cupin superfamily)